MLFKVLWAKLAHPDNQFKKRPLNRAAFFVFLLLTDQTKIALGYRIAPYRHEQRVEVSRI